MSERKTVPPPVRSAASSDPLAQWNEQLARLLSQADRLLREWQAHADSLGDRLRREGASAGKIVSQALEEALADVSTAAATHLDRALSGQAETLTTKLAEAQRLTRELEGHLKKARVDMGTGRAGSERARLTLALAASANVLVIAAIVFFALRSPATVPAPTANVPPPSAPVASGLVDAGAPLAASPNAGVPVEGPAPPGPPCDELPPPTPPHAARLVQECLNRACAPATPIKADGDIRAGGAFGKLLGECKPSDPSGRDLVAAMRVLAETKGLYKLACPLPQRSAGGGHTVTVAWLLECPQRK
jgi:hypothetical protein